MVLKGLVKDAQSGRPISSASVSVTRASADPLQTTTGEDGAFMFESLELGYHFIRVEAEEYMTHTEDVILSKEVVSVVNVALTKGEFEIEGRVIDSDTGESLKADLVLLKSGVITKKLSSNEKNGSYCFKNLMQGVYEIQVSSLCHSPRGWIGKVSNESSITVNFGLPLIEDCVVVAKCDVCLQTNKVVKYCKFCHAYICDECRHKYPERLKAMFRRRFSELHKSASESELDREYERELRASPQRSRCCSG